MITDSHFQIGRGHKVCQDYALHGKAEQGSFIVVSDGCSSTERLYPGAKTDVGARILCHALRNNVGSHWEDLDRLYAAVLGDALEVVSLLGIPKESLDATLMCCLWDNNGDWRAAVRGDGTIVAQVEENLTHVIDFSYSGNAPWYLSYSGSASRSEAWTIMENDATAALSTLEDYTITEKGLGTELLLEFEFKKSSILEEVSFSGFHTQSVVRPENFVALFSDGIKDFYSGKERLGFTPSLLKEMITFPVKGPGLVHRQMNIINNVKKWHTNDDFSMAVIHKEEK